MAEKWVKCPCNCIKMGKVFHINQKGGKVQFTSVNGHSDNKYCLNQMDIFVLSCLKMRFIRIFYYYYYYYYYYYFIKKKDNMHQE